MLFLGVCLASLVLGAADAGGEDRHSEKVLLEVGASSQVEKLPEDTKPRRLQIKRSTKVLAEVSADADALKANVQGVNQADVDRAKALEHIINDDNDDAISEVISEAEKKQMKDIAAKAMKEMTRKEEEIVEGSSGRFGFQGGTAQFVGDIGEDPNAQLVTNQKDESHKDVPEADKKAELDEAMEAMKDQVFGMKGSTPPKEKVKDKRYASLTDVGEQVDGGEDPQQLQKLARINDPWRNGTQEMDDNDCSKLVGEGEDLRLCDTYYIGTTVPSATANCRKSCISDIDANTCTAATQEICCKDSQYCVYFDCCEDSDGDARDLGEADAGDRKSVV